MDKGPRRASKIHESPQKYRPGGPNTKKDGALNDPLLLSPDVLDDATRRELLQDVLRPRRASPSSLDRPPALAANLNGDHTVRPDKEPFANQLRARVRASNHNSDDLLTVMAARLKDLESKHKAYQSELQELHTRYRQLNDRYQRERQLREEAETAVLTLYDEKEMLEQHLAELETATATPNKERNNVGEDRSKDRHTTNDAGADARVNNRSISEGNGGSTASATPATTVNNSGSIRNEEEEEKFDLFSGDFNEGDGEVTPAHFTNTALPGTLLFSPQKVQADAGRTPTPPKLSQRQTHSVKHRRHSAATVDVALLQRNAHILSDYVGWKGVVKNGNQAGIRERDVVQVVVYKNGICVNRGPFRPYGWALCDAFLDDLTEGYYPYEFKEKYPDGFPIEVTDRSTENCVVDKNGAAHAKAAAVGLKKSAASNGALPFFPKDGGRRLGGSPVVADQPRPVHTPQGCKDGIGYHSVSAAAFLSKIPKQRVTASGQLVSVREEVAAVMGVNPGFASSENPNTHDDPSNTMKRAAAAEAASRREKAQQQQQNQKSPPPNNSDNNVPATPLNSSTNVGSNSIAILVRLPDGRRVTLHVSPEDTVEALRNQFIAAAPQFARTRYELCQAYPVKCEWSEYERTLASFGIRKSCTLMVKLK